MASRKASDLHANRLLGLLPPRDYKRLRPHLHRIPLEYRQSLYRANKPIEFVYFIETGVGSLVLTVRKVLFGCVTMRDVAFGCFTTRDVAFGCVTVRVVRGVTVRVALGVTVRVARGVTARVARGVTVRVARGVTARVVPLLRGATVPPPPPCGATAPPPPPWGPAPPPPAPCAHEAGGGVRMKHAPNESVIIVIAILWFILFLQW